VRSRRHAQFPLLPVVLGQDSKQVLHVVPDLMGDYVGLRELASLAPDVTTTKAALKILEEARVEIHLLIDGAVERTIAERAKPQPDWVAPLNMTRVGG
jgi:hypothetical protein